MNMTEISLYKILFEQGDTTSIVDPNDIAKAVSAAIEPKINKIEDRLEKRDKEVATTSLSTTGAKPASGSRESGTSNKINKDLEGIKKTIGNLAKKAGVVVVR